jgi:hypothetical protein
VQINSGAAKTTARVESANETTSESARRDNDPDPDE